DYWGMAAFFGRLNRRSVPVPGEVTASGTGRLVIYNRSSGAVTNKRTNQPAVLKPLDGEPMTVGPDQDPRQRFPGWLTDPTNPFFARAVVNRYWAHFFGRGLVDPPDDMRVTNPPSNPALLDALAKDLVDHQYSLKHLVRTLVKSRTYGLGAAPNE